MLGIAVCAMYSTGAMVLLDGLEAGSASVGVRLETGPFFAYKGAFPQGERFFAPTGLTGDHSVGDLQPTDLIAGNASLSVRTMYLTKPGWISMVEPELADAYLSSALADSLGIRPGARIVLATVYVELEFTFRDYLRSTVILPEEWVLVSEFDHAALHPIALDLYNFVLLQEKGDATLLEEGGFTVVPTLTAGEFFVRGLAEARRIVQSIVVVSSVAIAALAFSLISLEARYRRGEMGTLTALGMRGQGMVGLYGLQVVFIVAVGTLLGLALGIVVANGLVSFAPFFGLPTIIRPQVTPSGLLLPLLSSLLAGMVGGAIAVATAVRRFSLGTQV